jgi:hypothetical protein
MTTIVINENTEDGRSLMNVIRAMRKGSKAIVNIYDDEVEATAKSKWKEAIAEGAISSKEFHARLENEIRNNW